MTLKQSTVAETFQIANKAYSQNQYYQAQQLCDNILMQVPHHIPSLHLLGLIAYQQQQLEKAIGYFRHAISIDDSVAMSYHFLGVMLQEKQQYTEAITNYQQAILLDDSQGIFYYNLASAFIITEQYRDAIPLIKKAISLHTVLGNSYFQLGVCYANLCRDKAAKAAFEKALQFAPEDLDIYNHLAWSCIWLGDENGAFAYLEKALSLDPQHISTLKNIGNLAYGFGDYEKALIYHQQLMVLEPNNIKHPYIISVIRLAMADYPAAWQAYEVRKKMPVLKKQLAKFQSPCWQGEDLSQKTLLVYAEQGYGDTLHFFRFMAHIKAKKIIFMCQNALKTLLETSDYIDEICLIDDDAPDCDFHVSLLSIPYVLQLSPENIYQYPPYIQVPKVLIQHWRCHIIDTSAFNIGLIWSGKNDAKVHNRLRKFPVDKLSTLAALDDVCLYSLQIGEQADELPKLAVTNIIDMSKKIDNFADSAALMMNVDLVISVDTAGAHLAGVVGQELWVLLSKMPDWRWKATNPHWYQHMRVFRQSRIHDWSTVLDEMIAALQLKLAKKRH